MASTSQKSPDTAAATSDALSTLEVRRRVKEALEESGDLDKLTSPSPELTDNARAVLKRRYQAKDREGNVIEEPDQMFHRVAHNLAQADRNYGATPKGLAATEEEFHRVMSRLDYLPNSPTLMNAGRELQMLSACFVLPVTDSMEAIIRDRQAGDAGPEERRRHRLRLQPAAPRRGHSRLHRWGRQRACELHARLRRRYRGRQAGLHQKGRQHGHPPRHPPGYSQVHRLEGRWKEHIQLQHKRGGDRGVDGESQG